MTRMKRKRIKSKRTTARHAKILHLKAILNKLDSIEETPANASHVRQIENRIDELLRKHRITHKEIDGLKAGGK